MTNKHKNTHALYIVMALLLYGAATSCGGGGGGGGAVYTPPAPRSETGSLAITSNTSGQTVYIDDKNTGKSISASNTITITGLSTGAHSVNLVLSGFTTEPQQVTVKANQIAAATFTMEIDIAKLTGKLVFAGSDGNKGDIYMMYANGTGLARLTNDQTDDGQPSWSHDGQKIVWCRQVNSDDPGEIYVMGKDGSNKVRLTNNSKWDGQPSFTNDDASILFSSDRNNRTANIFVMDSDGNNTKQLTNFTMEYWFPKQSPDGSKILYTAEKNGKILGNDWDVYQMDMNGFNRIRLSYTGHTNYFARWTPDGRILYNESDYVQGEMFNNRMYIMNSNGTGAVRLGIINAHYQHARPVMNGDGRFIYYTDSVGYLHVISADGCCDHDYQVWGWLADYNPGM